MDPDGIRKCMSLGYSSKKSNTTIGQRNKATQSVGLLSYTFLRKTGQEDVTVPMMGGPQPIVYESSEDWSTNLNILLKWSQFEDIGAHGSKVIIYNLWLNDEGIYGLSFDDDDEDKRLRDESVQDEKRINSRTLELRSHISYRVRHSLRVTLLNILSCRCKGV
ncbi:hypothetical protein DY000_02027992 [Brassica cretica]|uniref:Morc S5 domain-containing protein n=1 Tax=Brassica cretica TaxID=69181 RepID=A0ABQ7EGP9_BRACR|nr:hypothetical protein DY000_02027992 [Brassica cretica]